MVLIGGGAEGRSGGGCEPVNASRTDGFAAVMPAERRVCAADTRRSVK